MVEHGRLVMKKVIILTLGMDFSHESHVRLIQEVFFQENICVSLEGVTSVECKALVKRHHKRMLL